MAVQSIGPKYIRCFGCNQIHQVHIHKSPILVFSILGILGKQPNDNVKCTYYFNCPITTLPNGNTTDPISMQVTFELTPPERGYIDGQLNIGPLNESQQQQYQNQVDANAFPLQQISSVMLEYGKEVVRNSPESIRKFDELMIPLTTGLITVYFVLLKFLGQEVFKPIEGEASITKAIILFPTYFMLGSLIGFIGSTFPVPKKLSVSSISSIERYRFWLMRWRYIWTVAGAVLYLLGFFFMIDVIVKVANVKV
ncbi:hypothetical protein [Candidatus Nitrosocosmicus hydrocola]|uniref:hypothetical protein n=1 Tax=Candidatus Nitrosocosmicus hydrocola TaxID=1826872 RepID=UPI000B05309C|nr:hypothetical protein [Candidatus Nitrosocosmicus hydrocola]